MVRSIRTATAVATFAIAALVAPQSAAAQLDPLPCPTGPDLTCTSTGGATTNRNVEQTLNQSWCFSPTASLCFTLFTIRNLDRGRLVDPTTVVMDRDVFLIGQFISGPAEFLSAFVNFGLNPSPWISAPGFTGGGFVDNAGNFNLGSTWGAGRTVGGPTPPAVTFSDLTHATFADRAGGQRFCDLTGTGLNGHAACVPLSSVPEPSTWLLLLTGLFGLGFLSRRRSDPATA